MTVFSVIAAYLFFLTGLLAVSFGMDNIFMLWSIVGGMAGCGVLAITALIAAIIRGGCD
jgi:hypothetical protein